MKTMTALFGLLMTGTLIAWTPSHKADEPKTIDAKELREVLNSMEAKVSEEKDGEGKTYWLANSKDDVTFLVFQYGGKGDVATSISASAPFKAEVNLAELNEWNSSHRFVKAFGSDKGVMLEADLDVSVAPSKAVVKKFLTDFLKVAKQYKGDGE
ncbi:MAG: YbjN domain-containing protein [Chthonomonas sp.]|nr:YbjN domain-containing protein [Chthonomonas sp.]